MSDVHDLQYYKKCGIGGSLACGLTHIGVLPLDIVKCRMQASPDLYKSAGEGLKHLWVKEGFKGYSLGWLPTCVGYFSQGFVRFGMYEVHKDIFRNIAGPENAIKYQTIGFALSAASAEFLADFFLAPGEAVSNVFFCNFVFS